MSDPRQMRSDLVESARLDLVGPVDEHELLFDYRVRDRYLVGMLATDGTVAREPAQTDDESPDADKPAAIPADNPAEGPKQTTLLGPGA